MKNKLWIVLLVIAVVIIGLACKIVFAANPGITPDGSCWVGTQAGNIDSTGTDTGTNPVTVKTILLYSATATDTAVLRDGLNTDTGGTINEIMYLLANTPVSFGEGKVFRKGIYLNSITSGAKIFIYFK